MKQILIEKNGVEHIMNIPDGSKVTIDGNVVVFEPKFKKGDIVYSEWETTLKSENSCIGIYDSTDALFHRLFVKYLDRDNEISFNGAICEGHTLRLANIFQKANLFAKLNKEGKQWNAEKLCIEDLKAVPKVGDYVVLKATSLIIYCKVVESYCNIIKFKLCLKNGIVSSIGSWELNISGCEEKILSEEQFQSELAQLGFEYNFENDTISELKWKPKKGETIYYFDYKLDIESDEYDEDCNLDKEMYANGNCFKTKELCQQAIDKIKQVLSEK